MFTLYPLNFTKILYNRNVHFSYGGDTMAVLRLKNDNEEYKKFPPVLKEYASYLYAIKGNSEKTVCEYLLDLRTFFRFYLTEKNDLSLDSEQFEELEIIKIGLDDVREITEYTIIKNQKKVL